jgi:hypothetical protein
MTGVPPPFSLRPFGEHDREADYQLLLAFANAQAPQDPGGNEEWLRHRRAYDERSGQRRHYIAVHRPTQEAVGYAALERQQAGSMRIYMVFDPNRWPFEVLGTFLYQQLLQDAEALQATRLVCIEYATDMAFCGFLEGQGFRHAGDDIYNGFSIVRYERLLNSQEVVRNA